MSRVLLSAVFSALLVFNTPSDATDKRVSDLILSKKNGVVAVLTARKIEAAEDKPEKTGQSLGTGFFIGENTILTNRHVLEEGEGKRVGVLVASEDSPEVYEAEVLAEDPVSDIAVIAIKNYEKFKAENKVVFLEPTEDVNQTEDVYVIGHPWGLFFSVSRGIVSSTMRRIDNTPRYMIQTDAHVFNGNSGGPMLNDQGQVLGMNTAMLSRDGGSFGLAIPTRVIKKVLTDFKLYGEVRWSRVGIAVTETIKGVEIKEVQDGLPAQQAGMKAGDVVRSVTTSEGTFTPKNYADLLNIISMADSSSDIVFNISRSTDSLTLSVKPVYRVAKDFEKELKEQEEQQKK